jgi:tetratricopeptide (TPR) repeat protein
VVSRTSVMDYRGTTKKIPEIGRELHVAYVLEGSVRRAGNKVRVTGQLIRAATDEHVWAKSYDRDLTDIFAIQAELAKAIASELDAAISPREQKLLAQRPTENTAAYDLYLKSREIVNRGAAASREELQNRERLLLSAVELDPKFVPAWCELVQAHVGLIAASVDTTPARLAKATSALDRARTLAPDAPEVMRALGVYYLFGLHDSVRAMEQFEKLVQLQPNDIESRNWLGTTQLLMGRWPETLATQRLLTQLDPGNFGFGVGFCMTLRAVRRHDEAMAEARRIKVLWPDNTRLDWELAMLSLYATGSTREADERLARLVASNPDSPTTVYGRKRQALYRQDYEEYLRLDRLQPDMGNRGSFDSLALGTLEAAAVYRFLGDLEGARNRLGSLPATLRAQLELEPNNTQYLRTMAQVESILGHHEEALRWIERGAVFMPDSRNTRIGMDISIIRARILAWAGDKDRAIAELTRLLRVPSELNVHKMRAERFRWAPLVGDPRFEALLNDPKNNAPLF